MAAVTMTYMDQMGDLSVYPAANALAQMVNGKDLRLSHLLPLLTAWRNAVYDEHEEFARAR